MFQEDSRLVSLKADYAVISTADSQPGAGPAVILKLGGAADREWATLKIYGFTEHRYAAYMLLFKKLGVHGLGRDSTGILVLTNPVDEDLPTKGFVYSDVDLVSCRCNLDDYHPSRQELETHKTIYKLISPHWYIFRTLT